MRHQSLNLQIWKIRELSGEPGYVIKWNADTSHPCIDLYVDTCFATDDLGSTANSPSVVQVEHCRGDLVFEHRRFLALPNAPETKDRFPNPSLAQLDRFFQKGHAEPIHIGFQPGGALHSSVPVCVCLNDGHEKKILADKALYRLKVIR